MASRRAELIILCEDTQQEAFIRYWLEHHGFNPRRFRVRKNPQGRGSGEQFVRTQYPLLVKMQRQKASYSPVGSALIVIIDADLLTVEARKQTLNDQLISTGQNQRQLTEKIALLVPRRNIETWVYHVTGEPVDEESVYPKRRGRENDCASHVKRFAQQIYMAELPADAPPSLQTACHELRRIL